MTKSIKQKGFTLIELLLVISIITLLASVLLVDIKNARIKARDARRVADLSQLTKALESYNTDNTNSYPFVTSESTSGSWSAGWPGLLAPTYLSRMPYDPNNIAAQYGYYYIPLQKPTGKCSYTFTGLSTDYVLATRLENPVSVPNSCSGVFGAVDNNFLNYLVGQ